MNRELSPGMTSHLRTAAFALTCSLLWSLVPLGLNAQGLPYRLPTTVAKLSIQGVRSTPSVWVALSGDSTTPCKVEPAVERLKSLSYTLAGVVVADPAKVYHLPITAGAWSDVKLSATLSPDGRLVALTGSQTSRVDTFGKAFGQIVGIAAATAIAGPAGGLAAGLGQIGLRQNTPNKTDSMAGNVDSLRARADSIEWVPMSPTECARRAKAQGFREYGDSIDAQRRVIASLNDERSRLARAYSSANKADVLELALKRVAALETELVRAQSRLNDLEARRLAVITAFGLKRGVTEKLVPFSINEEVLLDKRMISRITLSDTDTLQVAWTVVALETARGGQDGSADCQGSQASKCLTVMVREPVRWTVEGRVESKLVTLEGASQTIEGVSPIATWSQDVSLSLPKGKLRNSELGITFGPGGQLATFEAKDKGVASTLAEATAATLVSSRDEFVKSLDQASKAQASILGMEQAQRTADIKTLLDQKALIDAQLAVATTEESADLLAAKQRLEVQLELLKVKGALATEEANQSESVVLLRSLTQQIALLRAEIDLLKLQKELEASRKESGQSGSK